MHEGKLEVNGVLENYMRSIGIVNVVGNPLHLMHF